MHVGRRSTNLSENFPEMPEECETLPEYTRRIGNFTKIPEASTEDTQSSYISEDARTIRTESKLPITEPIEMQRLCTPVRFKCADAIAADVSSSRTEIHEKTPAALPEKAS